MEKEFESVVAAFIESDPRFSIRSRSEILKAGEKVKNGKSKKWYVDLLATNWTLKKVFLCEVTYEVLFKNLAKRLLGWQKAWPSVLAQLNANGQLPDDFDVGVVVFIPQDRLEDFIYWQGKNLSKAESEMPVVRAIALEDTLPWKYKNQKSRNVW
ncbi:MAG: hypothetical protein ACK493_00650 [Planctomycetota bacterium]